MEWITEDQFEDAVERVLRRPTLIQGWMGYGSVTFFGFGDPLPPPIVRWRRYARRGRLTRGKRTRKHWSPSYRLKTNMSYWVVLDQNQNILGHSEGSRDAAEAALASLVGLHISGYELYTGDELDIYFSTGIKLAIRPYPENVSSERSLWGVQEPDGFLSWVRRDGRAYRIYKHEPLNLRSTLLGWSLS